MNELLDGEISTLNRRRLDIHVKKCSSCASEKASLKKVFNLLEELKYTEGKSISAVTKALTLPAKEKSLSIFKKWWLVPSLSSALVILLFFVLFPVNKKTDSIEKGIDYLSKNQNSDGSWGLSGAKSVSSASLGLIALMEYKQKYNTNKYDKKIENALNLLIKTKNFSGFISNEKNTIKAVYDNSYAIVALSRYLGTSGDEVVRKKIIDAVRVTENIHKDAESWNMKKFSFSDECIVSANQVMALIKAREAGIQVNEDVIKTGISHIKRYIQNNTLTDKKVESLELDIAAITVLLSNYCSVDDCEKLKKILKESALFARYANPCSYYEGLVFYTYYYDYINNTDGPLRKGVCKAVETHKKNDGRWVNCKDDRFPTASAVYFLLKCGKKA